MRKAMMFGAFLGLVPATMASAQTMPVSEFLAKVAAFEKSGPSAVTPEELESLKAEIGNSSKAVRAEQIAADKAGRKLAFCLPAKASMTSDELVAYFNTIPAAQREMPVGEAFRGFVANKYPCQP